MKDIAKVAKVSSNTVSRALNDKSDISIETRERILDIAKSMGYVHNTLAKSLRSQKTKIVGLVVSDNSNPFFCRVVKGIEDTLSQNGYSLILCNTDENYSKEIVAIDALVGRKVDGILITPTQAERQDISKLISTGISIVLIGRHFHDMEVDYVINDDKGGAFAAVDHLIRLGHKEILFINAPDYISSATERLVGYKEALEKNNLKPNPNLIRVCGNKTERAYNSMKGVLVEGVKFTAVFTFNDIMALGVIKALKEFNLKIPEDISIVGFDDIEFVSMLEPPLTTVYQQKYQLGVESARILLEKMQGKHHNVQQVVLPSELVVRGSTLRIEPKSNLS